MSIFDLTGGEGREETSSTPQCAEVWWGKGVKGWRMTSKQRPLILHLPLRLRRLCT